MLGNVYVRLKRGYTQLIKEIDKMKLNENKYIKMHRK